MKYVGSKNRISKHITPIIQSYVKDYYIEPFVGGANLIDKIRCSNKSGLDINKYLIALLIHARDVGIFPETIDEETYYAVRDNKQAYPNWFVGLVGFCATYGARFFEGFARDKTGKRDMPREGIKNLRKQANNLKDTNFSVGDYLEINKDIEGYTIYCDPPYNTNKVYYGNKFDQEEFYSWCREKALKNTVLVSGYDTPFREIWRGELRCSLGEDKIISKKNLRVEKLYLVEI